MIILDTNVISESFRTTPKTTVRAWLDAQRPTDLFLCAPVLAELHYGVERLATGARRSALEALLLDVESEFEDRVLPFDRASAHDFGRILVRRNRIGRPMATMDALIAAIAISHRMAIATGNIVDFAELGLHLINPFEPTAAP